MINFIKKSFQTLAINISSYVLHKKYFGALINKITLKIYRNIETLRKFIKLYFYRVSYQPHLLPELLKLIS